MYFFFPFRRFQLYAGPKRTVVIQGLLREKKNQSEDYNKTVELLCLFVVVLCSNK